MPELSRDALFAALRSRHHYGTSGNRLFLDLRGRFGSDVVRLSDDPQLGPVTEEATRDVRMGDIVRPGSTPMLLEVEIIGTAPIDRVDILHGVSVARTIRPYTRSDLGRRVRISWQGAEYRGRGRETLWHGKLTLHGNRFARYAEVNFLNPERKIQETAAGTALAWSSVTTGNLAGVDLWLDHASRGRIEIETNVVSGTIDLDTLADDIVAFEGGGLDRRLSVYRLPEEPWTPHVTFEHAVTFNGEGDVPVYVRVTQADGNQAWSSPIYLIA
jgi:hypothetical protein